MLRERSRGTTRKRASPGGFDALKTMIDIAAEAGLSRYTVSKVLKGDPSVRRNNREKVLKLCEKYGFVPNANAVNLVSGGPRIIGMIVPYITDGFYAELIEFAEKYASSRGLSMIYQSSYNDPLIEQRIIRSFMGIKVQALLLVPVLGTGNLKLHRQAAANFPVICLDRIISPDCCAVLNDNRDSCRTMTEHLFDNAAQVAYLGSFYRESNPTASARRQGYLDAVSARESEPFFLPLQAICEQQDNECFGYENIAAFLRDGGKIPDAICCVTDAVALGAMRALRDAGYTPGEDVLIGGHDNLRFCEYTTPPLSSMAQPKQEMATAAIDVALRSIADGTIDHRQTILKSELVIRRSSLASGKRASAHRS